MTEAGRLGEFRGWTIDRRDRAALLARFVPRYAETVADHVTYGRSDAAPRPMPEARAAVVVGRADDGAGVEALVVRIAGTTDRWDGGSYHITWSLRPGREAVENNAVIAAGAWAAVEDEPAVRLTEAECP